MLNFRTILPLLGAREGIGVATFTTVVAFLLAAVRMIGDGLRFGCQQRWLNGRTPAGCLRECGSQVIDVAQIGSDDAIVVGLIDQLEQVGRQVFPQSGVLLRDALAGRC